MPANIDPVDARVLDALIKIYRMKHLDVQLVRRTDETVEAFVEAIPEERREGVSSYWKKRKEEYLIEQGS
jgi:hypothetical protein